MGKMKGARRLHPVTSTLPGVSPLPVAEDVKEVTLTAEQRQELDQLEEQLVTAKCQHSDIALQVRSMEVERDRRHAEVERVGKIYGDRIRQLAREYGIDPDSPEKGRWNFDARSKVFVRLLGEG